MSQVYEILTGTVDGVNVTFTSTQIPEWGSLHVFDDGVEVTVTSFTETTITLAVAPATGSIVFAVYTVKPTEETALDLISDALREIGILGSDTQDAEPGDAQLALRYLNRMIAAHNVIPGSIFTSRKDTYSLVANQQSFTIGVDPAGVLVPDFQGARPSSIKNIVLQFQTTPTVVRDAPMIEITDQEWASKRLTQVYAIPKHFYYEKSYPLGRIWFYPAPSAAYTVEVWSDQDAVRIANLYDPISYPPEYGEFWLYQLALRLCTPFGKAVPQLVMELAHQAMTRVTATNIKAPFLGTDPALTQGGDSGYNYLTGGY
jgi:hypothetical protein